MTTNRQPVEPIIKGDGSKSPDGEYAVRDARTRRDCGYTTKGNGVFYPSCEYVRKPADWTGTAEELFAAAEREANTDHIVDANKLVQKCQCRSCLEAKEPGISSRRMIGCTVCGNKRCPHGECHINQCTGSNAPNQPKEPTMPAYPKDTLTKDDPKGWYLCQCIPSPCLEGDLVRWWDGENLRSDRRSLINLVSYTNFRPLTDATESGERIAELKAEHASLIAGLHAESQELCAKVESLAKDRDAALAELGKLKACQGGKRTDPLLDRVAKLEKSLRNLIYACPTWMSSGSSACKAMTEARSLLWGIEYVPQSSAPHQSENGDGLGGEAVERLAGEIWSGTKYGANLSWDILVAILRSHLPAPQVDVVVGPRELEAGTWRIQHLSSDPWTVEGHLDLCSDQLAVRLDTSAADNALREYKPKVVVSERHREAAKLARQRLGGTEADADKYASELAELFPEAVEAG